MYLPYQPDVGSACGAGAVNPGNVLDGVTMTAGHEYAETATDPSGPTRPGQAGGWFDQSGSEIADKCLPLGHLPTGVNIKLSTGRFAVQPLWSNNDGKHGGCVVSYISPSNQH